MLINSSGYSSILTTTVMRMMASTGATFGMSWGTLAMKKPPSKFENERKKFLNFFGRACFQPRADETYSLSYCCFPSSCNALTIIGAAFSFASLIGILIVLAASIMTFIVLHLQKHLPRSPHSLLPRSSPAFSLFPITPALPIRQSGFVPSGCRWS